MGELIVRYVKWGVGVVLVWVLAYVYNRYGCQGMEGPEMDPTIAPESFQLLTYTAPDERSLRVQQIVVYEYEHPGEARTRFVARIVGVPGDRVKLEGGRLFVNGREQSSEVVAENYRSAEDLAEVIVPRDSYFLLCDNRRDYRSYDSRGIGPVHVSAILGTLR